MKYFRLPLLAPLILILAVLPLVGCVSASKYDDLQTTNNILKAEIEALQTANNTLQAELETAKSDLSLAKALANRSRLDYDALITRYDKLKADNSVLQAKYNALQVTSTSQPHYTASQAISIVYAYLYPYPAPSWWTGKTTSDGVFLKAEFNKSTRQWMVTAWSSEEDSKKYIGATYLVDDATGKVLNPSP